MNLVKKVRKCLLWEKPYITLVVSSTVKPYRVYVVWVMMRAESTYITYFLHVVKLRANPEYLTRQMLRISYFWPDWNSYVRLGVFYTIFSTKRSHSCFFPKISVSIA